jgi:cobalamin biosynthesis protein CobT
LAKPNPDEAVDPEPSLSIEKGIQGGVSWNPHAYIVKDRKHYDARNYDWDVSLTGGARLRYEVRRLFEMSGLDEYQPNRRSGILDTSALHTVKTGNDRVFKRHIEEGGIDSAVVFVLDCSGSMFEERIEKAIKVLVSMLDTLDRAGVATCIITFGTHVSMFKPWEMTKTKAVQYLRHIDNGSDNSDSQALRYAHQLLLNRPERRKVAFVLADGGVSRDEAARTMSQSVSGERLGITTIGIGIQEPVGHMYTNNIQINNLDELATASFKQIKLAA